MSKALMTRQQRRQALTMTALALLLVFVLWTNILGLPQSLVSFVMTPFNLFVTYVHEAGHALAALVTGGRVIGFVVSADGSGLATTAGGSRAIILPAGYLGAAAFGSLLFFFANRTSRYAEILAFVLGAAMVIFTVMFARPDETGNPLALILGVGFGAALMFIGAKAQAWVVLLCLNVLAVMTALNAVLDLYFLVQYADVGRRGAVVNDAAAFSRDVMPILPPSFVAFVWAVLALLMLGVSFYFAVWKPLKHEINATYEDVMQG
jgi:hypothetical protein